MKPQKNPLHMNAKREDIAPIVVMPGDPLRAKYIAENFLTEVKEVTNLRNMLGFTGLYKGKRVTVMSHGMGMPSMSIYAFELFYFYNVQKVIRIGTCGVCSKDVKIPEVILADKICTTSNFAESYDGSNEKVIEPSKELIKQIKETAKKKDQDIHIGTITTADVFGPYIDDDSLLSRLPNDLNVIAEEMEGFALVYIANKFKRDAAVLLTATDSPFTNEKVAPEDRQTSLNAMIELALDSII